MPTFVANAATTSTFAAARTVAAVRGPDGQVLGFFSPGAGEDARLYLHAWLSLDPAAVKRQTGQAERTYSYSDVKARIGMGDVP
jgi:hypothetical protein